LPAFTWFRSASLSIIAHHILVHSTSHITIASRLSLSAIMASSLEKCPNEIIESIVLHLDFGDICSMRLTSRPMATKVTQGRYKSAFRTKHVDVTEGALRALSDMTQPGWLGCQVQHLVVVGIVYNTKLLESKVRKLMKQFESEDEVEEEDSENESKEEEISKAEEDIRILQQRQNDYTQFHESGMDVKLLSEAFSNIMANSKNKRLPSLSLEVVVYREDSEQRILPLAGGSWKFIWKSAAVTFHTTMRALATSGLLVDQLNIYNDPKLQRCSLACDELAILESVPHDLVTPLASLKSLSLSFSEQIFFYSKRDAERSQDPTEVIDWAESDVEKNSDEEEAEAADERNYIGIAKLLQLTHQLEELKLHQYTLGRSPSVRPYWERPLQRIAEHASVMNLHRLELRGLSVHGKDLLTLVQRAGVRKLSMTCVSMSSGSFRPLFDYCTSESSGMQELHCEDLSEQRLNVLFPKPGQFKSLLPGAPEGSDKLKRIGIELREPVIYTPSQSFTISSPYSQEIRRQYRREYGPPDRGVA